ncbi:gamma-glutamyltransferase family protein [Psychromarinibacter sp. C21-152]|uniref:Gamma-glutamyltransferase family protein n=1 Tax=Psychromarinibacter sediminicola TaxID=3033385 RepID=A0AAE3NNN7_9RHOB|nr:gamma-glutamyltransferase family protein [Psychromarinibacter sediminicola]MDF0600673.1 gamma-glutamyltransferase family protein [Psychromarinibacter sediminicola]
MRRFQTPGRSPVFAENGICATSHPLAAKVAVAMLEQGGNAVDAALAGSAVLGIAEPQMTGLGGDCFALIKAPGDTRIVALNGSGRAPAGLSAQDLRAAGHRTMPLNGVAAVTVPGAVDAFCRLSGDYGLKGLDDVLAPAIHYAEAGVPVAPRVAADWAEAKGWLQGVARDYYLHDRRPPRAGTLFRHPRQAEVLRRIAAEGRAGFYEGEVAEDMVASLRALGGTHTAEDFAATASAYGEPVSGDYRGMELVEHPPNGQGATAILMANILSHFDLGVLDPFCADRAHLEVEAAKLAYDARNRFLADPDHVTRLAHMLDPATGKALAGLIDRNRAAPNPAALAEAVHRDTIYITVIDRDRMAVSLICSIFHSFGSGLASDRFGILFQNRGAGFTLEAGHPNEAGGGKRPMHTIIPGMLRKGGRLDTAFGVMGGQYQPCGHVRFMSNMVDFGMDPQTAIDGPRLFPQPGGPLMVEDGYSDAVMQNLSNRGHEVARPPFGLGGAQAIRIHHDIGVLEGGSDPRKDGCALGY